LVPERVYRENKRVDGKHQDIYYHPSNVLPLSLKDEDKCLETVHGCYHDDGDQRKLARMSCNSVDEVSEVRASRGQDKRPKQIDENDESHAKAAKAAHFFEPNQLRQIVNGRINPSPPLRKKDAPGFGSCGAGVGIRDKFVRHVREVFGHQSSEVPIFAQR
jgi:hypothetical protein